MQVKKVKMEVKKMETPFIRGTVLHIGFMTIALMFLIGLIVIYFAAPPVFAGIVKAIEELFRAIRGEGVILPSI